MSDRPPTNPQPEDPAALREVVSMAREAARLLRHLDAVPFEPDLSDGREAGTVYGMLTNVLTRLYQHPLLCDVLRAGPHDPIRAPSWITNLASSLGRVVREAGFTWHDSGAWSMQRGGCHSPAKSVTTLEEDAAQVARYADALEQAKREGPPMQDAGDWRRSFPLRIDGETVLLDGEPVPLEMTGERREEAVAYLRHLM
jgi:hypothetical protein